MKKKLPWLKYDMKQAEYREAKERENSAAKALEEAANLLNKLKEPIKQAVLSYLYTYQLLITISILFEFELLLDEKVAYILAWVEGGGGVLTFDQMHHRLFDKYNLFYI